MLDRAIICQWDGESFVPLPRSRKDADRHFVIGERYPLVEWKDRSWASHAHEFAWLHEAWKNLPEALAESYPSPEHLRKRALIDAGFFDEQIVDAGSNAAAIRVAAAFRSREEFSLVIVRGPLVVIRTAKSQSRRAMPKGEFQRSKDAILETVSALIGVAPGALVREARRAAA